VDLQPDRRIKSVYSGQTFDPVEFMREDVAIEQARAARFQEFLATEAATNPALRDAQLDFLEAQLPYNCEHVVPQSWFGKEEPMRGDLHHLFACESGCNSFRGNTPYFDFSLAEEIVRQGCGRRETNRFEPTAGKGAVARATLYFLLRYPGTITRDESEYTDDRLAMLLDWHKQYPPGEYEKHRNQAIFQKQGNRNPLIDFPDWADRIDFRHGLG
jgi:endonuclease I